MYYVDFLRDILASACCFVCGLEYKRDVLFRQAAVFMRGKYMSVTFFFGVNKQWNFDGQHTHTHKDPHTLTKPRTHIQTRPHTR